MTSKKPETPAEEWDAIVKTAEAAALDDDDENETDDHPPTEEELDAALAAHGYDVAKINADAAAFVQGVHDALADEETRRETLAEARTTASVTEGKPALPPVKGLPPSNVVPLETRETRGTRETRRKRAAWTTMLLAAAVLGAVGVSTAITVGMLAQPKNPVGPELHLHDPPSQMELAKAKLHEADEACDRGNLDECSALLQQAAEIDPEPQDSPATLKVLKKREELIRAGWRDGGSARARDAGKDPGKIKGGK